MNYLDFPFIYEKKKEDGPIPLYKELNLPERLPVKKEEKEESQIIVIQL